MTRTSTRTSLTGTTALLRLALRRDRVLLPVWIVVLALVAMSSASATAGLYPTVASRRAIAETSNATPSLVAMYGPVYDPTSLGAVSMLKLTVFGALAVAILMILLVVRHTRAEEEAGRLELLRAGVLGRHASLAAALLLVTGASLVLGLLTALGLVSAGLGLAGSVALGAVWALTGMTFACVAAVTAQLVEGARAANGAAVVVLVAAYFLRALGDTAVQPVTGEPGVLSWVSPLGWAQQIRPYAGNRWALVLLPVALSGLLIVVAWALESRRDVGAGLVRPRLGRERAAYSLGSPLGLAWRLQRTTLAWWLVGYLVLGAVVGSIVTNLDGMLDSPAARRMVQRLGGTANLTDAFLATELGILAVVASAYAISASLRLRSEETSQRAEVVLATATSRWRWMASHVLVALLGGGLLMVAAGLGAGVAAGSATGDVSGQLGSVLGAALARVPAVWVLTAVAVALFGLRPRAVATAWAVLAGCLLAGEFGELLGLPTGVRELSPFRQVSALPGSAFSAGPLVVLVLVAAALVLVGFVAFRRRDLTAG
ncbi:MAG TPA: ABC transporter permease [Segeticoccus sp.]|uniref:ABC transporter permease n=1 Tax=Segeticoccus sp. TaxID=2706531 RepID=UPI002D80284D|nr:ABC transporter permease [Segeticoccus sp.]HET8600655.1 ABC transporter permease [Segeticoccus sp.]